MSLGIHSKVGDKAKREAIFSFDFSFATTVNFKDIFYLLFIGDAINHVCTIVIYFFGLPYLFYRK